MTQLRILIVDDHALIRGGLKCLIEQHSGWTVCGEAATGDEAAARGKRLPTDIADFGICYARLRRCLGGSANPQSSPRTETLMLSVHYSDQLL
jgi:DNA-binding NarL/FixJ family response regulator